MAATIIDYLAAAAIQHCARQGPSSEGYLTYDEILSATGQIIPASVTQDDIISVFSYLKSVGLITTLEDELAGSFYKYLPQTQFGQYYSQADPKSVLGRFKLVGPKLLTAALENTAAQQRPSSGLADVSLVAPASDRVVLLTDNEDHYKQVLEGLQEVSTQISTNNEVGAELADEKDRIKGEIEAGRILVVSKRARMSAIIEVLIKPLRFLAEKFVGATVGELAKELLKLLIEIIS